MTARNVKRPKARRANRIPRLGDVMADVRDRIVANGLTTGTAALVSWPRLVESHATGSIPVANDTRLHFDPSATADYRERMLAAAAAAICGVLDHDRGLLAARG